mgnify:FL=1
MALQHRRTLGRYLFLDPSDLPLRDKGIEDGSTGSQPLRFPR